MGGVMTIVAEQCPDPFGHTRLHSMREVSA
jgi:hypothetical protein